MKVTIVGSSNGEDALLPTKATKRSSQVCSRKQNKLKGGKKGGKGETLSRTACKHCGVTFLNRPYAEKEHNEGKRHQANRLSDLLYGELGHEVATLICSHGMQLETSKITPQMAARARSARKLVTTQELLSCCGWELYSACDFLIKPDLLCLVGEYVDSFFHESSERHWSPKISPAGILCIAERLHAGRPLASMEYPTLTPYLESNHINH